MGKFDPYYPRCEGAPVLVEQLRKVGLNSDAMQILGLASIAVSIRIWRGAKRSGDAAHSERLGIFVGLWALTFFAIADQLVSHEVSEK